MGGYPLYGVMMHSKTCVFLCPKLEIWCAALWHSRSASGHLSMCLTHCHNHLSGFALSEVTRREWITLLLARSVYSRLTQPQAPHGFHVSSKQLQRHLYIPVLCNIQLPSFIVGPPQNVVPLVRSYFVNDGRRAGIVTDKVQLGLGLWHEICALSDTHQGHHCYLGYVLPIFTFLEWKCSQKAAKCKKKCVQKRSISKPGYTQNVVF